MDTREFVTNFIYSDQHHIIQRIKSLSKLLPVGLISVLGLLPLTSMPNRGVTVYAQQIREHGQIPTADPWYQSLEGAQSKEQVALSPGAFGYGVPELHNLTTNNILMAIGISVLGGMVVYMAVKALSRPMNKELMHRISLLNKWSP